MRYAKNISARKRHGTQEVGYWHVKDVDQGVSGEPRLPRLTSTQVGAIRSTSTDRLLLKNIGDGAMGLAGWFLIGYGIAAGDSGSRIAGDLYPFFIGEQPAFRLES